MDQKLSYFTEDPGLSMFHMHYRHLYPSWFNFTRYGHNVDYWGRQFYYTQKLLYNNYFLNRLSNNMPDVEPFVYNKPIKVLAPLQAKFPNTLCLLKGTDCSHTPPPLYPYTLQQSTHGCEEPRGSVVVEEL
jgi:hypothetical protein